MSSRRHPLLPYIHFLPSYAADGRFLGMELAAGNLLQLCNASALEADAAWHFGTKYRR